MATSAGHTSPGPRSRQSLMTLRVYTTTRDGVVTRIVHPAGPPRVEYHLTDWGQSLCPALDKLLTWAEGQPST